jgi:septal ring factor EnvC (AmiA/AmiB activator)
MKISDLLEAIPLAPGVAAVTGATAQVATPAPPNQMAAQNPADQQKQMQMQMAQHQKEVQDKKKQMTDQIADLTKQITDIKQQMSELK